MTIKTTPYAVVTGASSGIGKALATECAKAGFTLFLVARDSAALHDVAKTLRFRHKIKCYTMTADLTDPEARKKVYVAAKRYGVATHLINNAGFGDYGPFAQTDWPRQTSMIELNITAVAHLTRLFLPDMVAAKTGRILNVASHAAFLPGPLMSIYYATKHFVLAFSESLAEELRGSGITVTALCPGPAQTKFESVAHMQNSRLFSGKLATPQKIAAYGFKSMQSSKRVAVYGFLSRIMLGLSGLVPRTLKARYVARAQALKQ